MGVFHYKYKGVYAKDAECTLPLECLRQKDRKELNDNYLYYG